MSRIVTFIYALAVGFIAAYPGCLSADEARIPQPVIPPHQVKITDFGAVADGATLCTEAIDKSIQSVEAAGGGTVDVPAGRYLTMPFSLANNIDLHLDKGATILISADTAVYPKEGGGFVNSIVARNCHDVSITGKGIIDGQGAQWWPRYKKGLPAAPHRPMLVVFDKCQRVLVQDVTIQNAPCFHLVPGGCTDVTIQGVTIKAPADSPNTDGCDPSGHNFLISDCTFDVGDDCIAVKPGHAEEGQQFSCTNFTIEHCTFLHGHGMSIGGQTRGGLNGMVVRDCEFDGTLVGIRMKSARGVGGLVENVSYSNLKMTDVQCAIFISSYYPKVPKDPSSDPPQPVSKLTPQYRDISITNVTASCTREAGRIIGLPEMPISGVTLTNVHIQSKTGFEVDNGNTIKLVNSTVAQSEGAAVTARNADVVGALTPTAN